MGQVKIWLNSQPDISEIPKFLLLIMIVITVLLLLLILVITVQHMCCNTCVAFHNKES